MTIELQFEHVSKQYRLGTSTASLRDAVPRALARLFRRRRSEHREKDTLWALKDVSFAVEKGQALGIVGPNGAGKTTILKLLSKITQPTDGTITVNGRVSALIELGAGFHPDLTGQENLYLNASILGIPRRDMVAKYDSIVEFSGLKDFMNTPVKRYSSGMYVRLGFSIAAHVEPDILLVDEVLAVGDASFRRKCIERIKQLREQGTTIVFVSHNTNLVRSACDRGLFLKRGKVQVCGEVVEAIRAYEAFLHSDQSNWAVSLNLTKQILYSQPMPVEILDIEFFHDGNPSSNEFSYADSVQVQVTYRTQEPIRSPSLLARIIRSDGTTCCEIRTRNEEVWLPDLEGVGHISFFIEPLQLASGAYVMEVRLQDTADAAPLGIGQSDWFRVSGPGVTVVYEYGGVFVPQVRWGFDPNRTLLEKENRVSRIGNGQ